MNKPCSTCKDTKPYSEFHVDRSQSNGLALRCKACRTIASKKRYEEKKNDPAFKLKAKSYRQAYYETGYARDRRYELKRKFIEANGGECEVCGYDKCLGALDFHHRDPSQKGFLIAVSRIAVKNWDMYMEEAKKCALLCSNCHREEHHLANELETIKRIEEEERL
tara:strand:+ start:93 stop:587 length:495 start_codon:yes stop_codon:yes gene_type:complete